MTPEQSAQIWDGLEARLAGVETFVHDAPPWAPPADERSTDTVVRPVALTGNVRAGRAIQHRDRASRVAPAVAIAAAIVVAVLGIAVIRPPLGGPGATPSPSVAPSPSASPSASPSPTAEGGGDFGTAPPAYTTFVNPAYGWSVSYDEGWSVVDDPFLAGPRGVTQFVPWNAGELFVLVGAADAGAPKPCSGCGTFTSRTVDDLAVEVLEFLRLDKLNPSAVSDLARTIAPDRLDGEDARYGYQTYPPDGHDFPSRDFVFVAMHDDRQYVIVLTPNIPRGDELDWFPRFAHDFRFTAP
ncbi:MAG TPA: hypothetical protein VM408_08840 [Methylomirabilota bacterium]|nr:hypothetical protein [Methylomirabilota bacterium]